MIGSENHADQNLGTSEPGKVVSSEDFEKEAPFPASASDEPLFSSAYVEEMFMTSDPSDPFDILPNDNQDSHMNAFLVDEFSWAMIELGVEEPLPPQDTIDELYVAHPFTSFEITNKSRTQIFFSKIHPSTPIIHQYRFLAERPPVSLRYAIWALAATITPKYAFSPPVLPHESSQIR